MLQSCMLRIANQDLDYTISIDCLPLSTVKLFRERTGEVISPIKFDNFIQISWPLVCFERNGPNGWNFSSWNSKASSMWNMIWGHLNVTTIKNRRYITSMEFKKQILKQSFKLWRCVVFKWTLCTHSHTQCKHDEPTLCKGTYCMLSFASLLNGFMKSYFLIRQVKKDMWTSLSTRHFKW